MAHLASGACRSRFSTHHKTTGDEDENNALMISSLSPVDAKLETLDPTPNIWHLFERFNNEFFYSRLVAVEVCWSPRMTRCAGMCCYQHRSGYCSVRLSKPLLQLRSRRDLVETLLHEMIHAYLFVTQNNDQHESHGDEFHRHMRRINDETGSRITVYHSFHDEVDHYLVHWWRCDGNCRTRSPYYGYVKRAMNRAPSSLDLWWSDHVRDCGGTFTKVKEPEGFGQRKVKKVKTTVEKSRKQNKLTGLQNLFAAASSKSPRRKSDEVLTIENLLAASNPTRNLPKLSFAGGQKSDGKNDIRSLLEGTSLHSFIRRDNSSSVEDVLPDNKKHASSSNNASVDALPSSSARSRRASSPLLFDEEDLCIIPDEMSIETWKKSVNEMNKDIEFIGFSDYDADSRKRCLQADHVDDLDADVAEITLKTKPTTAGIKRNNSIKSSEMMFGKRRRSTSHKSLTADAAQSTLDSWLKPSPPKAATAVKLTLQKRSNATAQISDIVEIIDANVSRRDVMHWCDKMFGKNIHNM